MKAVVVCMCALVAVTLARPEEKYTDKYNNVDIPEILNNKRLLDNYFKCLMDQGKCTPEGEELKPHIQDALENECAKCDDVQREKVETVMRHLVNKEPEKWNMLTGKYDPKNIYTKKYEDRLRKLKE